MFKNPWPLTSVTGLSDGTAIISLHVEKCHLERKADHHYRVQGSWDEVFHVAHEEQEVIGIDQDLPPSRLNYSTGTSIPHAIISQ